MSVYTGQPLYTATAKFTAASSATDIFTLVGASGKQICLLHASVTGIQNSGGERFFFLVKRSSDNTGGTSNTVTGVPISSKYPPTSAICRSYTANPSSLGTIVGNLQIDVVYIPASGNHAPEGTFIGWADTPIAVLNSASEIVSINLDGVTITGNTICCHFVWCEL